MKLIHKKFIGKDTQIIMVYSKGRYTVSICINDLKNYCNQLYRIFNDKEEGERYYKGLCELEDQF